MWHMWTTLLVSCALVAAEAEIRAEAPAPATTRAPHRTLDRQAAELAWRSWLQSPESGNQNAPPRRITTKSLFITPLVCPKGQRLDSNGCVQVVTVNKDEHERILLEQLNALFTPGPSGDVVYDYGDEEPGPLQLSIPIGNMEPQAAPLQAQEPSAQAQEQQPSYAKVDKKDDDDAAAGVVAELELLQLQHSQNSHNDTASAEATDILNHNVLQALDKPKRNSPDANSTETSSQSDEGQKELVYGHVNVDPVLYDTDTQTEQTTTETEAQTETVTETTTEINNKVDSSDVSNHESTENQLDNSNTLLIAINDTKNVNSTNTLKKYGDQTKLNPETDYGDIGEAIKLISRYAEVTTDDSFNKNQKKYPRQDDSVLGTRTKLQYRRNKPKPAAAAETPQRLPIRTPVLYVKEKMPVDADDVSYPKEDLYYRYPWQGQHSPTPPPDYPFRHIQDYWPGRNQVGGVYNTGHENPRRHHHAFPHSNYRPHSLQYASFPGPHPVVQNGYAGALPPVARRAAPHHARPMRSHTTNQDLYTLLGLRHWFSSEGTSKR